MAEPRRLDSAAPGFDAELRALTEIDAALDPSVEAATAQTLVELEVPRSRAERALAELDEERARALRHALERIRAFHERQVQKSWDYAESDGTRLGQRITPLARVGLYVPGGKAAYPSSVLMNAVPAKVAGVGEIVMVSPKPNPLVLAAAALAGVDRVIGIGGAQAIGALAYGTKRISRVDKIVGPGNAYVAEAKRQVFGEVGIDMVAGPSEILVIADGAAPADWVAMDLFSQAEHDESAQAILLSPNAAYLDAVEAAIGKLIVEMPRRKVIASSLKNRGALILTRDLEEACAVANRIAPEHLELMVEDPDAWLPKLTRAGAVFLGQWTSEALGDYCAGPNHVLPTAGTARFSSPLGVYDFQKRTSVIAVSRVGAQKLGKIAAVLAEGEGLPAHQRAAEMRMK